MTLATRCPACGTVFRVVQDQLRVSEGWVRCGRCSEAFNALESMVAWPAAPRTAPVPATDNAVPAPTVAAAAATVAVAESPIEARFDTAAAPPEAAEPPAATVQAPGPEPTWIDLPPGVEVVASDGALNTDLTPPVDMPIGVGPRLEPGVGFEAPSNEAAPTAPAAANVGRIATGGEPLTAATATPQAADELPFVEQPAPSFVREAERAARWRRPGVRLALGLLSLLAALGLAAQVTYTFRDRIAAASPAARPLLQQACAAIGCRVGEYRQIDALSVESSGLVRVDGAPVYRLAVTLRNRAAVEVAAPALDLALTDAQGLPIARRVLQMSDLNLPLRSLKPGSELPLQVPLGIGGAVSGYTIEIFYP